MELEILDLGRIQCKKLELVATENEEERIYSPMVSVLIRHPQLGTIVYDTGNSPFYSTEYPQEELITYPIDTFISIEDALAEKGLTPSDVDMLIISHLHFDHVGGLRYFRGTKAIQNVIVSDADLREACARTMTGNGGAYMKPLFDFEGVCYKTVGDEGLKLADDLELFVQKSHTPGCMGMIVNTKDKGTVIFTSDTIYTRESYEKALAPGGAINKTTDEFYDNLHRIQAMEKEMNATLFFGHDYDQAQQWRNKGIIR
ncbi:MAG: N-acyl homoserine lactonase family protein [Eggerthellaceae bacterium]